ncbi:MAG: hypothetical protein IJT51_04960, partial [Bacteroidales bacterium]|nr:hypothetical protein [Bacteroidales bacterium]
MKHLYRFILLFFICSLFLVTSKAQTITNSYVYTYDSIYIQQAGSQNFPYTGAAQTFNAAPGTYTLQVWGAQGGNGMASSSYYDGGYGGYSIGTLNLSSNTTLYICVGGKGEHPTTQGSSSTYTNSGGFNGGGDCVYWINNTFCGSGGGGASDIRIGTNSLYSRVIVAGGGGGSGFGSGGTHQRSSYAYGGGTTGGTGYASGYTSGTGGSQTSGASFGQGGNGATGKCNGGGGGGWYGGSGAPDFASGGGGSGYVYTSSTAGNYPSGCLLNSSYYLTSANTYAGNTTFASTSGSTETGHSGNGYAKISYTTNVFDHLELKHTTVTTTIHDTMCGNYTYSSFNFNFKGDTMAVGNHTYTRNIYISSAKDSIVILNIYVEPNLADVNYQDSVCYGTQSYFNHGFVLNIKDSLPGAYTYTRSEAIGHCTQNHILTLKLKPQNYIHYYDSICQGQNYVDPHGYGFERVTQGYAAGDYNFKRNEYNNGCFDSVILHLHIRAIDTIKHTQYICANSSYSGYGFVNLSDTGVYTGVIPSANGCGDVVILTLKHNPVYNIVIRDTIRHGVIYTQHDYVVRTMDSTAGTYNYVKNLHTVSGCDSVVTLELCIL